MYSIHLGQNVPIFIQNWPKLAIVQSKIQFFGLRQAIPRSIALTFRVLDAKLQVILP